MKIAVIAPDASYIELSSLNKQVEWQRMENTSSLLQLQDVNALFNLREDAWESDYSQINSPVFINSVCHSLQKKGHSENIVRINGWNGFLLRSVWEIAGTLTEEHQVILNTLNKKYTLLPDEPGFVTARIIAMIINEAYFAKEEHVSTEEEIDIAMKLGTNYPKGPFEWCKNIGIKNIYNLLNVLAEKDNRYTPSLLLKMEANQS